MTKVPPAKQQSGLGVLRIRNKELIFGSRTFIMGIVNVTPDSFSQDGVLEPEQAVTLALSQIEKGADIIDIGGQSTRPGYEPIDPEDELKRIMPVVKALRKASDVIISIDTFSAVVLEQALTGGADMLNSIWGLTDELLAVIKKHPLPVVITHNKPEANYPNGIAQEVADYLAAAAAKALDIGLSREQIILDPGIGFGKTADDNLELLSDFEKITRLGFPTLVGSSRKSTIGKLTGKSVNERTFGTAAAVALAIAHGVDIVRVHDIEEMLDVVKVSDALVRRWRPENWQA